jgi:hypothetical protein
LVAVPIREKRFESFLEVGIEKLCVPLDMSQLSWAEWAPALGSSLGSRSFVHSRDFLVPNGQVSLEVVVQEAWGAGASAAQLPGVFVGIQQMEYLSMATPHVPGGIGPYAAIGAPLSVAAGRISFSFGLKGGPVPMPLCQFYLSTLCCSSGSQYMWRSRLMSLNPKPFTQGLTSWASGINTNGAS